MSRSLRSGAPRMFGRHGGQQGRRYDAQYRALLERYGPFDAVARAHAAAVAAFWCEHVADCEALSAAEEARRSGKGRRPSHSAIARLKKRKGLSWASYEAGVRRLEELTNSRRRASFAETFAGGSK